MIEFATFEMYYPGVDWRKLTWATFQGRLKVARDCHRYMADTYTQEDNLERWADDQERTENAKKRFPSIWPTT